MSNKSAHTHKRLRVPRPLDEIRKEVGPLYAQAGFLQYEITMKQRELEETTGRLKALNHEAFNREKLDSLKKQAEETKKDETNG